MAVRAGALDRRITIQRASITYDALNNPVQAWSDLATVWASRQDVRDTERLAARELGSELQRWYRVRSSSVTRTVNAKDRLIDGSQTCEITGVKEVEGRMRLLEISAVVRGD